jgi:hypothetical protein
MVARTRSEAELVVIFSRDGGEPETKIVPNGERAAVVALLMIANAGPAACWRSAACAALRQSRLT